MTARLLRLLRGRSPEELGGRLSQQGFAFLERAGIASSERNVPVVGALRLASTVGQQGFASSFVSRWPTEAEAIVTHADRLLAGEYDLLGYSGLEWGSPPDWQLDPVLGRRAPMLHWSRVPYLSYEEVGDHKVIWELNRHQWIITLAQAWCLTGESRYASRVAAMLTDWLEKNPPRLGINWASSLELAFRSIAWCWILVLLEGSDELVDPLRARILNSVELQGRHIERYLSTWFSPNTHLTGEALALLHLGTALPSLPRAAKWRRKGWEILEREAERQIRGDGVYFEQATWYQGYTVDFYLHAIRLRRSSGGEVSEALVQRVTRAAEVLASVMRPDGRIPLLGDDDGGRLLPLRPDSRDDFRDTMALAALVLSSSRLKPADDAPASSLAWIADEPDLARYDALRSAPPRPPSEAFPDGGLYVVRDTGTTLVMDGGPHGALAGAHSHADALSLTLDVNDRAVLTDSGTFTYLGAERDSFRGTAAHNTVEVDGEHSSEAGSAFRWESFARSEVLRWFDGHGFTLWEAVHDGYGRLPHPVLHRRIVLWLRDRYGIVCDVLEGEGSHQAVVRFHAAIGATMAPLDASVAVIGEDGPMLRMIADRDLFVEPAWTSAMYGSRARTQVAKLDWSVSGGSDATVTVLIPETSADGPASCQRVAGAGAIAWSLEGPKWRDRFVIRTGNLASVEGVDSDTDVCWLREDRGGRAVEVVSAGAGSVRIHGEEVLTVRGGCRRAWRNARGVWTVEEI